jgi:transposase-like protein
MLLKIKDSVQEFNSFLSQLKYDLLQMVSRRIEQQLVKDVDSWLYREHHARRQRVGKRQSRASCIACGSQQAKDFSRNGYRERQIVTSYGVVNFALPRVRCQCGGSVQIPFSILQPYQRWWEDVLKQIGRWAQLGLSLRQMQEEIGAEMGTQVGLRKLNQVVQSIKTPTAIEFKSVPPIIMLDAIWVTLLRETGEMQKDKLGRKRRTKAREKVCVLVALGIYPQSQHWGILDWELADSEDQEAWERLLLGLENRGLYRERGLELLIHDGGKGLIAALNLIYPKIPHQRCLFHKLRNLWQSIQTPEGISRKEKQAFKREIIQQAAEIFYAKTLVHAQELRDAFCQQWQATQTELVATLQRDWHESIAFYRVLEHFPKWPPKTLRSTSLLERVNRMLRRLFRSAGAYHSPSGLLATVVRVLQPMCLI